MRRKFYRVNHALCPAAKICVTRMLTRDLFAVAKLLVGIVYAERSLRRQRLISGRWSQVVVDVARTSAATHFYADFYAGCR